MSAVAFRRCIEDIQPNEHNALSFKLGEQFSSGMLADLNEFERLKTTLLAICDRLIAGEKGFSEKLQDARFHIREGEGFFVMVGDENLDLGIHRGDEDAEYNTTRDNLLNRMISLMT